MATKKKFKMGLGDRVKGGFKNTHTILTSGGVVTLGTALGTAGAAYTIGYGKGEKDTSDDLTNKEPEKDEQINTDVEKEQDHQEDINTAESNKEPPTTPTDSTPNDKNTDNDRIDTPKVDPEIVSKEIVDEDLLDFDGLDFPTIVSVDSLQIKSLSDGSEIIVAEIHTLDGEQYQLADIDGDGFYTDVFDMMGNLVGEAEGNLCYSDLELMVEELHGYLAINPNEPEPISDDSTNDIIDTEDTLGQHNSEDNSVAVKNQTGQDNSSDNDNLSYTELLQLLLRDGDDAKTTGLVDIEEIENEGGEATDVEGGEATDIEGESEECIDEDNYPDDDSEFINEDYDND